MSFDTGRVLFVGDFLNPDTPLWAAYDTNTGVAADIQVSTLTVNAYQAGNILLQSCNFLGTIYNAPIIFQRPATGGLAPLGPVESLVMNRSLGVPTYPINSYFISATKFGGTAYDDLAVNGIQIFGNQATSANEGAAGYITRGPVANTISMATDALYVSSIFVSSLSAGTVVSTTTGVAESYTASLFMSTPILYADTLTVRSNISSASLVAPIISTSSVASVNITNSQNLRTNSLIMTNAGGVFQVAPFATFSGGVNISGANSINGPTVFNNVVTMRSTVTMLNNSVFQGIKISTSDLTATTATISSLTASTINSGNINVSTLNVSTLGVEGVTTKSLSSIVGNITFNVVSTLQLTASISPNINLGLGNVIQGLIGGAATQALGVTVGSIGLATGSVALVTGRTQGGVNPAVFQTVNGSTQLQFSTIGINTQSIFLDTDSVEPLTTPGDITRKATPVLQNTYCVRSVGDPLNIDSSSLAIQMFGQWVPVVQDTTNFQVLSVSSFNTSSINGFKVGEIVPSTINASSINMTGNLTNVNRFSDLSWNGRVYISSFNVSSINGAQPGATYVPPDNIFLSTITMSGNLVATNLNSALTGFATGSISNFTTTAVNLRNGLGNLVGSIAGSTTLGQGFQILAASGLTIARDLGNPPQFVFNIDQTININSTLKVSTLIAPVGSISTLNVSSLTTSVQQVSTLNAQTIVASNLNVSTLANYNASVSTLTVSTINGQPYTPGAIVVPPTLFVSTISMSGNLETTNLNSALSGFETGSISNFTTTAVNLRNSLGNLVGSIAGSTTLGQGFQMLAAGGLTIAQNLGSPPKFVFNTDQTININSTLKVSTLIAPVGSISTLNVSSLIATAGTISTLNVSSLTARVGSISTLNVSSLIAPVGSLSTLNVSSLIAPVASISTLNVSSLITPVLSVSSIATSTITTYNGSVSTLTVSTINGQPYGISLIIPSTINLSTVNVSGNLTVTNPAGVIQGAQTLIQSYSVANTNNVSQGTISGGNPDLGLQGVYIASPNGVRVSAGGNFTQPIFAATVTSGFATLTMGAPGSANSIINSQIVNATSNVRIYPTGSPTVPLNITAPNNTDGLISAYGALSISTNTAVSGVPGAGPFNVNGQTINLLGQENVSISSSFPTVVQPGINTSTITVSSINGAIFPQPVFSMPVGSVIIWSGLPVPPAGWLICDGSAVSTTTYAALYAVIGLRYVTIFQPAPPAGNFYLPDLTYSVPMGGSQIGYAPIISVRTGPDINSYCAPGTNKLWEVQAVVRGHLNLNTRFRLVGAVGDIFIAKFINWNPTNNNGYLLVICNDTTIPYLGPGFVPLTSPGGTAGDTYTSGKYGGTGVPNTVKTLQLEELAPHTHGGSPGTFTTGTGASPPQAGTNGPAVNYDGTNTINGVGVANNSFVMAPSYVSMYYIIKS